MKLWSKAGEGRAVLTGSPATEPEDGHPLCGFVYSESQRGARGPVCGSWVPSSLCWLETVDMREEALSHEMDEGSVCLHKHR